MGLKNYYEAIRAMPDEYVAEDTVVREVGEGDEMVIAVNPRLNPILYRASTMSWEKIKENHIGVDSVKYKIKWG